MGDIDQSPRANLHVVKRPAVSIQRVTIVGGPGEKRKGLIIELCPGQGFEVQNIIRHQGTVTLFELCVSPDLKPVTCRVFSGH